MKHRIDANSGSRSRRIAALLPIALAALLLVACGASAAPSGSAVLGPAPWLQAAADEEVEEEEIEEEVEWEWGEEEEFEEAGEPQTEGPEAVWEVEIEEEPPACVLPAASARVVVSDARDTLRLAVRYTAGEPTPATIEYRLEGARGALQLRPLQGHLRRRGTIAGVEHLSGRQMAKVRAASLFVVHVETLATSQRCARHRTLRLSARHSSRALTTWSEPQASPRRR